MAQDDRVGNGGKHLRRRFFGRVATAIVLASTVLVTIGPSTADADRADPFFGVLTQSALEGSDFDTLRWARIGTLRIPLEWRQIEPEDGGDLSLHQIDSVVDSTARRGVSVLPTIYGTPSWLSSNWRTLPVRSGYEVRRWRSFLARLVDRYGTDGTFWLDHPATPYRPVTRWQVWNEPNIRFFARPVSPRAYSRLLRISASLIRRVDSRARVVLGGLYSRPRAGAGIPAERFLRRMYRFRGVRNAFDLAALHPYARTPSSSLRRTRSVRAVLNRHRDARKRLTLTELGWGSDDTTGFGTGSVERQALFFRSAYGSFVKLRKRLRLDSIYWFSWADLPEGLNACSFCFRTGFFDLDGQPKPVWFELLNFTHSL